MVLSIILNSVSIGLICLGGIISITILVRIFKRLHPSITNISVLLTCNTYFTIILFCLALLNARIYSLYGHLHPSISLYSLSCKMRAYIRYVCFCAFYYSFVLQAIFRLFRVVFYKKRSLQQFYVFIIAVFLQWFVSFLFMFPHVLLNDFEYQSFDYACWISFRNIRAIILITLNIYGCPLAIILFIYTYILHHVHRAIQNERERQRAYKRNAFILRRIGILLVFLVMFGVSTLMVLVVYSISNYMIPFAYEIQTINISIGLVSTPIILMFITPRIRYIFKRRQRPAQNTAFRRHIQHTITDSSWRSTDNYN